MDICKFGHHSVPISGFVSERLSVYPKVDKSVKMQVAVDSKYWLWINGHEVVFEGGLKRGPNPNDTYYDELEISRYLKKGKNVIALLLWYWGRDGFCHKSSGESGLLVRLSAGRTSIVSDASWKVKIHPAFGATAEPYPNYRLPEWNVHFDARNDIGSWFRCDYNDKSWHDAVGVGHLSLQAVEQLG
jgi:hypothetical protein